MAVAIVLFYKYFDSLLDTQQVKTLESFVKCLCRKLGLKGRLLLAQEGVNGTVSGSQESINDFITNMETFKLSDNHKTGLFDDVDWKQSRSDHVFEPFPDLKISQVKEIISTGQSISVEDVKQYGGTHLSPQEFHQALHNHPDSVVIDVRNTFEHNIGHFDQAINPETTTFSSFEQFCEKNLDSFRDRKVLMYCTGGIRCEKASAMLRKRGIDDVSQLNGGIHRYLEQYGDTGYFRGKNFVFDQRIYQNPAECKLVDNRAPKAGTRNSVVGKCIECHTDYDELCGSCICTVCRDLVLVCPSCQATKREYHCKRHSYLKTCYFTFLEVYNMDELEEQQRQLAALVASTKKNVRKTLVKQLDKVTLRIKDLQDGTAVENRNAPRRCRTCFETNDICDGRCWGFWKVYQNFQPHEEIRSIQKGDTVRPGPHWNALRLGDPELRGPGVVVERKTWGANSSEEDCVSVQWQNETTSLIYRWGVVALDGSRRYDLEVITSSC